MTTPKPDPALCHYAGMDTTAAVYSNDDGTWSARCHCGTVVTTTAATPDEAAALLVAHRGPAPTPDRHPLARIARAVGTARAVLQAVLAVPAVALIVGADLPRAVDATLGALVALLATLVPLWTAVTVRRRGEQLVTPVADPRTDDGHRLVPAERGPDGAHGVTDLA